MNPMGQMGQMGQMNPMGQMGQMNPMGQMGQMNPMGQMGQMNPMGQMMGQMNPMGQMMGQMNPMGQMMGQMGMNNLLLQNVPEPTSVTLQEAFEHYKSYNYLSGENKMYCQCCKFTIDHAQSNHLYTLPEILPICLNRGKGNKFKVGISFPETINLSNECETKLDNHNYRLICIITHLGPDGVMGHFIAFCFLEEKNCWYKFDDSIVSESTFEQASNFGQAYVLFYKRTN